MCVVCVLYVRVRACVHVCVLEVYVQSAQTGVAMTCVSELTCVVFINK